VEEVPSKDIATISEYLQTWELKFSTIKAVLAVFHFNNKETKRELWMAFCARFFWLSLRKSHFVPHWYVVIF